MPCELHPMQISYAMPRLLHKHIPILSCIIDLNVLERVPDWQLLRPTIITMSLVPASL